MSQLKASTLKWDPTGRLARSLSLPVLPASGSSGLTSMPLYLLDYQEIPLTLRQLWPIYTLVPMTERAGPI